MVLPNFRERFESSLEEARKGPKPFDFRKELQSLVEKKHKQGMLDDRFDNLLKTQDQHLGMYLTVFCQETGKVVADLAENLSSPTMDYDQILHLAASLKEASVCIGCPKMEDACSQLYEARNGMNQEGCHAAFKRVKGELISLKLCLGSISKLHGIIRQRESDISLTERMELSWSVECVLRVALLGAGFYTILVLSGSLIRRKRN